MCGVYACVEVCLNEQGILESLHIHVAVYTCIPGCTSKTHCFIRMNVWANPLDS